MFLSTLPLPLEVSSSLVAADFSASFCCLCLLLSFVVVALYCLSLCLVSLNAALQRQERRYYDGVCDLSYLTSEGLNAPVFYKPLLLKMWL